MKTIFLLIALTGLQGCATMPNNKDVGFWDRYEVAINKFETCGINLTTAYMLAPIKGIDMEWDDICNKEWFAKQGGKQ